MDVSTIIGSIVDVWDEVMTAFSNLFSSAQPIFYDAQSGLTFLGTLATAGLAVSVILLVFNIVKDFLHFR